MTAQESEVLYYNGKTYWLSTEPLESLLEIMGDEKPVLISQQNTCRRGYVGTWQIENDKLYLIDFKCYNKDHEEVGMDYIFPDQTKVFAGWYTGEIKIPQGKMLYYERLGYMSIYEKDLFLNFNKGILVATREVDNTKTFDPEDPGGWDKLERGLYESYLNNLKKGKPSGSDDKNPD
jgi:hypothetical protein